MNLDFEVLQPKAKNLLLASILEDRNYQPHSDDLLEYEGNLTTGDIFNSNVYFGKNSIYRNWYLSIAGSRLGQREQMAKISLRFDPSTSVYVLIVNGEAKWKSKAVYQSGSYLLQFKLFDSTEFELDFRHASSFIALPSPTSSDKYKKYQFTLHLAQKEIKELRKMPDYHSLGNPQNARSNSHGGENGSNNRIGAIIGRLRPPLSVTIPSTSMRTFDESTRTVYMIRSVSADREQVLVERRFSDFLQLDAIIRGSLGRQQLPPKYPVLPKKVYNPFLNQFDQSFLTTRRVALEKYLQYLLTNPKVRLFSPFPTLY
jgi:hypothetical protein